MSQTHTYRMAPLIRGTLVLLYLVLVLPLAPLAPPELRPALLVALPIGLALVLAISSEQVQLEEGAIRVSYPSWCGWLVRRGWQLSWDAVTALTPVATSQGGRVFYLRSRDGGAYLLPQRVERFEQFLAEFGRLSGVDTSGIGRISPPWTYRLLAALCAAMLLAELAAAFVLSRSAWLNA